MITQWINALAAFMQGGGVFMWIIAFCWVTGIVIALDKYFKLLRYDMDGPSLMNELQKYILSGDVQGAIKACSRSRAMLPRVLKNGLKRSNQSSDQIQNAIDATALEMVPKLEGRLNYLSLIANISTLLGLLGTIYGLINSFGAVAVVDDPNLKAELLAKGIALAMNTTALGLISAITVMVLHAVLTSKSDSIISSIDEYSVKLMDMLGTRREIR